jgi:hypothetical protein
VGKYRIAALGAAFFTRWLYFANSRKVTPLRELLKRLPLNPQNPHSATVSGKKQCRLCVLSFQQKTRLTFAASPGSSLKIQEHYTMKPIIEKRIELLAPPPGAPESEKAVLLAAILDRDRQPEIFDQLDPDYFTDQDLATLARSAIRLWKTSEVLDLGLLVQELKDKKIPLPESLIGGLINSIGQPANWQEHLAIIRDRHMKRQHHSTIVADLNRIYHGEPSMLIEQHSTTVSATNLHRATWPDALASEAYHGITGELVRLIEPHTEADPVALLVQFLVAFGSYIGRTAYFCAEANEHYCNLFLVLVGNTAKGRKGTSWGYIHRVFRNLDQEWADERIANGLSSGEGLIHAVRDPVSRTDKSGREIERDPGIIDKRLFIQEGEFGSVLRVMGREKNTLSSVIRNAWDGQHVLQTMVKNDPNKATAAHISFVGHITRTELTELLSTCDSANGVANRFIWLCSQRSKSLPEGGNLAANAFNEIVQRLHTIINHAKTVSVMTRDPAATKIWAGIYGQLSDGKPGLLGMVLARAEAQVMRLATIYALLDCSVQIRPEHLNAALAVWLYAEQSARYIFGAGTGSALADRILSELVDAKPEGMTRTEINDALGGHTKSQDISKALTILREQNLAAPTKVKRNEKNVDVWQAV